MPIFEVHLKGFVKAVDKSEAHGVTESWCDQRVVFLEEVKPYERPQDEGTDDEPQCFIETL